MFGFGSNRLRSIEEQLEKFEARLNRSDTSVNDQRSKLSIMSDDVTNLSTKLFELVDGVANLNTRLFELGVDEAAFDDPRPLIHVLLDDVEKCKQHLNVMRIDVARQHQEFRDEISNQAETLTSSCAHIVDFEKASKALSAEDLTARIDAIELGIASQDDSEGSGGETLGSLARLVSELFERIEALEQRALNAESEAIGFRGEYDQYKGDMGDTLRALVGRVDRLFELGAESEKSFQQFIGDTREHDEDISNKFVRVWTRITGMDEQVGYIKKGIEYLQACLKQMSPPTDPGLESSGALDTDADSNNADEATGDQTDDVLANSDGAGVAAGVSGGGQGQPVAPVTGDDAGKSYDQLMQEYLDQAPLESEASRASSLVTELGFKDQDEPEASEGAKGESEDKPEPAGD